MDKSIRSEDVFVPGAFPIEDSNAYADRGTPQKDTAKAIRRGYVPLVYGGYGVGKSSMVARVAKDFEHEKKGFFVTSCGFGLIEQAAHRTADQVDHRDEVGLVPVATCA